jgi:hypothetical protein
MKIRQVGAELIHADRRTDMTKLIVVFRNFSSCLKTVHSQKERITYFIIKVVYDRSQDSVSYYTYITQSDIIHNL